MEKVKIKGMKKSALRSSFSFEKNLVAMDAINNILGKLGILEVTGYNLKDLVCKEGSRFLDKIDEFVDEIYNLRTDDYSVDVIFGKETIFLIANSRVDRQVEVSEAVFEFGDFGDEEDGNGN